MKKYFLIPLFVLILFSFQVNAQCCHPIEQQSNLEKSNQQKIKMLRLKITGMTCAGCSNHVSTALKNIDGIIEQTIEYLGDIATTKYDASKTNPTEIKKQDIKQKLSMK